MTKTTKPDAATAAETPEVEDNSPAATDAASTDAPAPVTEEAPHESYELTGGSYISLGGGEVERVKD